MVQTSHTYSLLVAGQLRGVGPAALREIARRLTTTPDADIASMVIGLPRVSPPSPRDLEAAESRAASILGDCERDGILILSVLDEQYPKRLKDIPDPPPLLYIKGDLSVLDPMSIAVVGTREASTVGAELARRIAKTISESGFSVTSGLALGIDTAAHNGALDGDGKTMAVLAHGLDIVTPASNQLLADAILAAGGALLAEHAPGVPPRPPEYVKRNRIQSGLSEASVMVESGETGGSIHQARFTRDQGRDLYAVLPEEGEQGLNDIGGRMLVREMGAEVLRTGDDLTKALQAYREFPGEPSSTPEHSDSRNSEQMELW